MPRYFANAKYPEAKSLPALANDGLLQKTTGGNTQPSLLSIKEVPLQRFMSAGCQIALSSNRLTKPVTRPEYGGYKVMG